MRVSVTPVKPVARQHERSASCFNFRRTDGVLEVRDALCRNPSSRSFGTFAELADAGRRSQDKSQDLNRLTAADRYIIEYLTNQYHKDYPVEEAEIVDDRLSSRRTSVSMRHQPLDTSPFVTVRDIIGPSAWCLILMVAMIVADIGTTVSYHAQDEIEMFRWCLLIPHIVCIVLLFERLCGLRRTSGYLVSIVATLWYIFTAPLLRFLPVLTLMTATFDKVLMLSGDPTDTTEFVNRHEWHAFNDLVWIGALYCVPMASFQLYACLLTKVSKGEPTLLTFQLVSICCGTLLASVIAAVYSFSIRRGSSERQSFSQQLLVPTIDRPTAGYVITRIFAWFVTISSKVLIIAVLIKLIGPPLAILVLLVSRIPMVLLISLVSEITWSVGDVITVAMLSPTYLVASSKLGPVRDCIEKPRIAILHSGACLVEAASVLLAALLLDAFPAERVIQMALFEGAMLFLASLLFFLSHRIYLNSMASIKI
ncbi:uncharacterized protein LOC100898357 [Galendromus occidentalis]|uniref:Uncharacterized protein LOC100898357 n=1 Tax=Galendromus occidentalis TaxID=34638 RepID=A0AAJ7P9L9_9ACAR|nr:uncharacterized protein LOC100898357 [Galendromus occidentalis]